MFVGVGCFWFLLLSCLFEGDECVRFLFFIVVFFDILIVSGLVCVVEVDDDLVEEFLVRKGSC